MHSAQPSASLLHVNASGQNWAQKTDSHSCCPPVERHHDSIDRVITADTDKDRSANRQEVNRVSTISHLPTVYI